MQKKNTVVIIPVFNEENKIASVIDGIKKNLPEADIVVINDGSDDNTANAGSQAGARILNLPFNLGYGAALQTGYKFAFTENYQYLAQLDGDGQHDPSFLPQLLTELKESNADLIIGSRVLSGQSVSNSFCRRAGSIFFAKIISWLIHQKLTDPTSGYQAMKRPVLKLYIQDIFPHDYPDADVLLAMSRSGIKIKEVPVTMKNREEGQSMHSGLKPVYYVFKMVLSIFVTLLRKNQAD